MQVQSSFCVQRTRSGLLFKMPKYKLTYYDIRGRGELIRLIFKYAGIEFEDERLSFAEFPKRKQDDKCFPFATIPTLHVDDVVLCQSIAIARYLGREFGLAGANNIEGAKIDMLADQIRDIRLKVAPFFYTLNPDADPEKVKLRESFIAEYLPWVLSRFECILKQNNGGKGFFVGEKATWVDLSFLDIGEVLECIDENAFAKTPLLKALFERIKALPKIKEYLASRSVTPV